MTAEMATIRLSRLDRNMPWGFRLHGGTDYMSPLIVCRVNTGGLAEQHGLREGDFLSQICSRPTDKMTHTEAQDLILNSGNELDLLVERTSTRIWAPLIKPIPVVPGDPTSSPVKYSLAHNHEQTSAALPGSKHNVAPRAFKSPQQGSAINNNMPQTTTTVRTVTLEPSNSSKQEPEQPAYLRSATLKLINESEKSDGEPRQTNLGNQVPKCDFETEIKEGNHQGSTPLTLCDSCGRYIQGVFCRASGKHLHPECFTCTTCGSNLKNKGYYTVGNKLYCEVHAKQPGQNQFKATPPIDPNLFYSRAPPLPALSPKMTEPVKASYQPEILKRGDTFHAPQATSLSPQSRGVPTYSPRSRGHFRVPEAHEMDEVAGYPTRREASPTHLLAPMKHLSTKQQEEKKDRTFVPTPNSPSLENRKNDSSQAAKNETKPKATSVAGPRRGKGSLKQQPVDNRVPYCKACNREIRGPFVVALNNCWCPNHFECSMDSCHRNLLDAGFVELEEKNGRICCDQCFENRFAPRCRGCTKPIMNESLSALQAYWHSECFKCAKCRSCIGNRPFFIEGGAIYCEQDWNQSFTAKCDNCQFPIETGDRYVEALSKTYHADCFTCTTCQKSLEGQSFYGKGNRPYCEKHV